MNKINCISPDYLKPIDTDFRNYYKSVTRDNIKDRLHHYDNDRIIRLFINKLTEKLLENRSGVLVKRIGYFFIYRHPFLNFTPSLWRNHLKPYMITFLPTDDSIFKYWMIDFRVNRTIVKKLSENVKKGYRYLNLMHSMISNENINLGGQLRRIKK